jgi:hypothetical protein
MIVMSETRQGHEVADKSEKEIADRIIAAVEWLAWVKKNAQYDSEADRLGYYEVDQHGPRLHDDVYFGRHIVGLGEEEVSVQYHQIRVLASDLETERGFWGTPVVDITVADDGTVNVNDEDYSRRPAYIEASVDHFFDWFESANPKHSARDEQI